MLVHNVYFALKDNSDLMKQTLLAACRKHLTDHPGVLFFACGLRAAEMSRPVNDAEFDVALHIAFESKAAHDVYQDAPRHQQFVEENRPNWAKVRVFDSQAE